MKTIIEEGIRGILAEAPIGKIAGFCATQFTFIFDGKRRLDHSYWVDLLVSKLKEEASFNAKEEFISQFAEDRLRVCSNCGEFMTEGYYLNGDYACCDECGINLYEASAHCTREEAEQAFREDLSHAAEDEWECYYTNWE